MSGNKVVKTFRLSPRVVDLVEKAADTIDLSEAEIIEGCVVAQVENVVRRHERLKRILSSQEAVEAVAAAGRKRPRDERSDKGTTRGKAAPAGLDRTQQS